MSGDSVSLVSAASVVVESASTEDEFVSGDSGSEQWVKGKQQPSMAAIWRTKDSRCIKYGYLCFGSS